MEALRDDDLNLLYAAALAFGADWRRPVDQLAAEHLPNEPLPYREALSKAVVDSRSAVEAHIEHTHQRISGNWTKAETTLADAWIAERFPG